MNEKFGVSLELITDKFKSKIDSVKNMIQTLGRETKKGVTLDVDSTQALNTLGNLKAKFSELSKESKNQFNIEIGSQSITETESRLQELSNNISNYQELIQYGLDNPSWSKWNTSQIEDAKDKLNSSTIEVNKLREAMNNLDKKSNLGQFSSGIKNMTNNMEKGFDKSMSKLKRFTLALVSIRSVFSLVSRASSSYLSQDTALAEKLRSAWIGLGSFIAPLLEKIANFTIRAVSYINVFIKAMTGVDLLASATKKSMDSLNKSAGKTQKTLASFDEIINIDTEVNTAGLDMNWTDAFKDVELNPEIVKFFERLGKFLKPAYERLKEFFQNFDDYSEKLVTFGVALLGAFTGIKLASVLSGIGAINGAIGPLLVLDAILISVAVLGVVKVVNELKDLKQAIKDTQDMTKSANEKTQEWSDELLKNIDAGKLNREDIDKSIGKIFDWIDSNNKLIESYKNQLTFIGLLFGLTEKQREQMYLLIDQNKIYIDTLEDLRKKGQLTKEQQDKYVDTLKEQIDMYDLVSDGLSKNSDEYKKNDEKVQELNDTLKTLTGKDYRVSLSVEADTSKANGKMNTFFDKLKRLGKTALEWLNLPSIFPSFDVGTNYVPNDMLATIHEGEAIIPKKFNSSEYFSNINKNEDVVKKLDELIDRVERIEINPYTTIVDVGNASQKYRNQQSRIMGEELT